MAVWLHQMSGESYAPEEYRETIWEGEVTRWRAGSVRTNSGIKISPGDTLIFVFVKTGTHEPGIYGWAVVSKYKEASGNVFFRPCYPSDYLKMNPIWDDKLSNLLDVIRGPVKVGTMWEVSSDHADEIKKKIHDWIK
jgi:hypothetical protein